MLNSSGAVVEQGGYYYGYSRETAWDPVTSRIYFIRDGLSPNDLHYDVIDQATGRSPPSGETPYHGDYNIQRPIRVSANGQYVLLGSGDIYAQAKLRLVGLGGRAGRGRTLVRRWPLVTLTTRDGQTTLRRLGSTNLATLEQRTFAGEALRVVGTDTPWWCWYTTTPCRSTLTCPTMTAMATAYQYAGRVPAGCRGVGRHRPGWLPDAWNPGRSQADSTTGLALDAFPQDAACWLPAHGSGGTCNYGATIPNYMPGPGGAARRHHLSTELGQPARVSLVDQRQRLSQSLRGGLSQGFSTAGAYEDGVFGRASAPVSRVQHRRHPLHRRERGQSRRNGSSLRVPWASAGLASAGNYLVAQAARLLQRHYITTAAASSPTRAVGTTTRASTRGTRSHRACIHARRHQSQRPALRGDQPGQWRDHLGGKTPTTASTTSRRPSACRPMASTSCSAAATSMRRRTDTGPARWARRSPMHAGSPTARW